MATIDLGNGITWDSYSNTFYNAQGEPTSRTTGTSDESGTTPAGWSGWDPTTVNAGVYLDPDMGKSITQLQGKSPADVGYYMTGVQGGRVTRDPVSGGYWYATLAGGF